MGLLLDVWCLMLPGVAFAEHSADSLAQLVDWRRGIPGSGTAVESCYFQNIDVSMEVFEWATRLAGGHAGAHGAHRDAAGKAVLAVTFCSQ